MDFDLKKPSTREQKKEQKEKLRKMRLRRAEKIHVETVKKVSASEKRKASMKTHLEELVSDCIEMADSADRTIVARFQGYLEVYEDLKKPLNEMDIKIVRSLLNKIENRMRNVKIMQEKLAELEEEMRDLTHWEERGE